MPWGAAKGQNLGHLRTFFFFFFFFALFSFMKSFVFEQKVLFRVYFLSVTSDYRVQYPRVELGVKI